jgi:hypothetical protein
MPRRALIAALTAMSLAMVTVATIRVGAQDTFRPKSDLEGQLHDLAEDHALDQTCGPPGDPPEAKKASRAQNRAKNNFYVSGEPVTITQGVLRQLQKRADDRSIPHGSDSALPADRSILIDFFSDRGTLIGEGTLVRLAIRMIEAHFSNKSNGEGVNCHETGEEGNDIHVALSQNETDDECLSVTAEISPHFRPEAWTSLVGLDLQNRPLRFTGQLFFDASHVPCRPGKQINPKRSSLWEIHPVYAIDVCKSKQTARCKASDESMWQAFDAWMGEQEQ